MAGWPAGDSRYVVKLDTNTTCVDERFSQVEILKSGLKEFFPAIFPSTSMVSKGV